MRTCSEVDSRLHQAQVSLRHPKNVDPPWLNPHTIMAVSCISAGYWLEKCRAEGEVSLMVTLASCRGDMKLLALSVYCLSCVCC